MTKVARESMNASGRVMEIPLTRKNYFSIVDSLHPHMIRCGQGAIGQTGQGIGYNAVIRHRIHANRLAKGILKTACNDEFSKKSYLLAQHSALVPILVRHSRDGHRRVRHVAVHRVDHPIMGRVVGVDCAV